MMINPCGWCGCGPYHGARTVACICSIVDLISVLNSAYTLAFTYSRERSIVISTSSQTESGHRMTHLLMNMIESTVMAVALAWHVLRFILDLLLGYGIQKKTLCAIYPWVLSTITALIGLFALDTVYFSILAGWNSLDMLGKEEDGAMSKHFRDRASMFFIVVLITMTIYLYFLWVVVSFLRSVHAGIDVDVLPDDALPPICRRGYRNGRIFQHAPGHHTVLCPECQAPPPPFSQVVLAASTQPPPAYEEALKMPRVQGDVLSNENLDMKRSAACINHHYC